MHRAWIFVAILILITIIAPFVEKVSHVILPYAILAAILFTLAGTWLAGRRNWD